MRELYTLQPGGGAGVFATQQVELFDESPLLFLVEGECFLDGIVQVTGTREHVLEICVSSLAISEHLMYILFAAGLGGLGVFVFFECAFTYTYVAAGLVLQTKGFLWISSCGIDRMS